VPEDFNVSREALTQDDIPVLGVCLGFQGLAFAYGGHIRHAPVPFHGRTSMVRHENDALFAGIPEYFHAVRYHSLIVERETLPADLLAIAYSECGLLMGLRHRTLPKWGVQFHPESILTVHGKRIIRNFRDLVCRHHGREIPEENVSVAVPLAPAAAARAVTHAPGPSQVQLQLHTRTLTTGIGAETAFLALFARQRNAFWLDSQRPSEDMARFSFMGCVADDDVFTCRLGETPDAQVEQHLRELDQMLESAQVLGGEELPFQFRGGCVGFMTYEMKAAFGARRAHENLMPDSMWMRVERFVAFDHHTQRVFLVAAGAPGDEARIAAWMDATQNLFEVIARLEVRPRTLGNDALYVRMDHGMDSYLGAIARCKEKIVDGESYEVCLTNGFSFDADLDPLDLYMVMRRENAAPFGAFMRCGEAWVLSTSPERLIKVDSQGRIQSKPIKGTCARHPDPEVDRRNAQRLADSEKDRAENLMIVDLMRNDLARVSEPGSVRVTKLMDIESYVSVHQMVSTVESVLRRDCSLLDLLRAIFPGGSITGAPKIRTMEIIDEIEPGARGVYCGTIGYLGYGRVADLNIAIRTLSYDGRTVRFGAGGAITYLSNAGAEFDEVLLKAEAVLRPIWHYMSSYDRPLQYEVVDGELRVQQLPISKQAS
jgi:para-aminobenzoate synthetase